MAPARARGAKRKPLGMTHQVPARRKRTSQRAGRPRAAFHRSAPRCAQRRQGLCRERLKTESWGRGRAMTVPTDSIAARSLRLALRLLVLEAVVGGDDLLHQRVADDVALVEAEELDPLDVGQHLLR